ncbi:hypothetical protein Q1695_000821 [Nippostrongylus brasiliensis]|nr:hypothetical protein Q1695_000821 [Nippostrongylus brasiliensis]
MVVPMAHHPSILLLWPCLVLVGAEQISAVVEWYNLRSDLNKTQLTCHRIKQILVNDIALPRWHCIGGTKASSKEPGMWIAATSPLVNITGWNISLEISYDEVRTSTVFNIEKEAYKQLTSEATLSLASESANSNATVLNVTMAYILHPVQPPFVPECSARTATVLATIEGIVLAALATFFGLSFYRKKQLRSHERFNSGAHENYATDAEE